MIETKWYPIQIVELSFHLMMMLDLQMKSSMKRLNESNVLCGTQQVNDSESNNNKEVFFKEKLPLNIVLADVNVALLICIHFQVKKIFHYSIP